MNKRKYGIALAVCLALFMVTATVAFAADTQQATIEVQGYVGPVPSSIPQDGTPSPDHTSPPGIPGTTESTAPGQQVVDITTLPQTGDTQDPLLYLLLAAVGCAGIVILTLSLVKKRRAKEDHGQGGM